MFDKVEITGNRMIEMGNEGMERLYDSKNFMLTLEYRWTRDVMVRWMQEKGQSIMCAGIHVLWLGGIWDIYTDMMLDNQWKIVPKEYKSEEDDYLIRRDAMIKHVVWISNFDMMYLLKNMKRKDAKKLFEMIETINRLMFNYRDLKLSDFIDDETTVGQHLDWVVDIILNEKEDRKLINKILLKTKK